VPLQNLKILQSANKHFKVEEGGGENSVYSGMSLVTGLTTDEPQGL